MPSASMVDDSVPPDATTDEEPQRQQQQQPAMDGDGGRSGDQEFNQEEIATKNTSLSAMEEKVLSAASSSAAGDDGCTGEVVSSFALSQDHAANGPEATSRASPQGDIVGPTSKTYAGTQNPQGTGQEQQQSLLKKPPPPAPPIPPPPNTAKGHHHGKRPPLGKKTGKKYQRKHGTTPNGNTISRSDSMTSDEMSSRQMMKRRRSSDGQGGKKRRRKSSQSGSGNNDLVLLETSSVASFTSVASSSAAAAVNTNPTYNNGGGHRHHHRIQYKRQRSMTTNQNRNPESLERLLLTDPLLAMVPHKSVTSQRNYHPLPPLSPSPTTGFQDGGLEDDDGGNENTNQDNETTTTTTTAKLPLQSEDETRTAKVPRGRISPSDIKPTTPAAPAVSSQSQQQQQQPQEQRDQRPKPRIGDGSMGGTIPAAELMNSVNIVHHTPGTYPLPYLATILGFEVPPPPDDSDDPTASVRSAAAAAALSTADRLTTSHNNNSSSKGNYDTMMSTASLPSCEQESSRFSIVGEEDPTRRNDDKDDDDEKASTMKSFDRVRYGIPHPNALRFRTDDIFFQVPPEGNYYHTHRLMMKKHMQQHHNQHHHPQQQNDQPKKVGQTSSSSSSSSSSPSASSPPSIPDANVADTAAKQHQDLREGAGTAVDDAVDVGELFDSMDPFYMALLKEGWDPHRTKPAVNTSKRKPNSLRTKVLQEERKQRPVREKVVGLAREIIGLSPDWTFQDWTSYWTALPHDQRRREKWKHQLQSQPQFQSQSQSQSQPRPDMQMQRPSVEQPNKSNNSEVDSTQPPEGGKQQQQQQLQHQHQQNLLEMTAPSQQAPKNEQSDGDEDDDILQELNRSTHSTTSLHSGVSDRSNTTTPTPEGAEEYLKAWANAHITHPYPKEDERLQMMKDTGLSKNKIFHWFKNFRSRHWDPSLKKIHSQSPANCPTSSEAAINGIKPMSDETTSRNEANGIPEAKSSVGPVAKSIGDQSTATINPNNFTDARSGVDPVVAKNDRIQDVQEYDDGPNLPLWSMDGSENFSSISGFGIVAFYKGEPVAVLRYNFKWYHLDIPLTSTDKGEESMSTETDRNKSVSSPTEAELIMVVEGIGWRTSTTGLGLVDGKSIDHKVSTAHVVVRSNAGTDVHGGRAASNCTDSAPPSFLESSSGTLKETSQSNGASLTGAPGECPSTQALSAGVSMDTSSTYLNNQIRIVMLSLAFEHARACSVWYSFCDIPQSLVSLSKKCFRMVTSPQKGNNPTIPKPDKNGIQTDRRSPTAIRRVPMLCDLSKCSSRYALLCGKEEENGEGCAEQHNWRSKVDLSERLIVHMPSHEDARSCFGALSGPKQRSVRTKTDNNGDQRVFQNGENAKIKELVRLQVVIDGTERLNIREASGNMVYVGPPESTTPSTDQPFPGKMAQDVDSSKQTVSTERLLEAPNFDETMLALAGSSKNSPGGESTILPKELGRSSLFMDLLNYFPLPPTGTSNKQCCEILDILKRKQNELAAIEKSVEIRARDVLVNSYDERKEYDRPEEIQRRMDGEKAITAHNRLVEQRKELDQVWQEQLEEEMNAVCSICNDGEVTPDNQILFCDSCNVAVHQMCYGVDHVPEGDYYCIACIHFRRDKVSERRAAGSMSVQKPSPLPIVCELCPIKQGAYTRTEILKPDAQTSSAAKWVHMTCAKWQGLDFIVKGKADLVEDVSVLKEHFLRLGTTCTICKGRRGAYNKCRHDGCDQWMHVSCARASGVCEVIHGEDVDGPVTENPWTLSCPDHSQVTLPEDGEKVKHIIPIELLIKAANEFPPEPIPPPLPQSFKAFNKLSADERKVALADSKYEEEFLHEVLTKKLAGVRCEVCDMIDDEHMSRCGSCGVCVCFSCQITDDPEALGQRHFTCLACRFLGDKDSRDQGDEVAAPHCKLCNQEGGLLLHASGEPLTKKSHWKKNLREFENSLFAKLQWTHFCCAFWGHHDNVVMHKECRVDCSNVIMSNGTGFVLGKNRCGLCGMKNGLKAKCAQQGCRNRAVERQVPYHFHATCARQAGFELDHQDGQNSHFYVHCYNHSGNENNLRARLEDLIEIERRRAGKQFWKSSGPMRFTDGCRLLNGSILVLRILGWAWRWAEWWVEYGSTWEPLLEPGQIESKMTDEQLRIVNSSPESRRDDARRCRLAALGAALRNRDYDTEEGFDSVSLDRALRAVLHTPSLIGPLKSEEIDFFADWLGRAYRSKSRLLGFGSDRMIVADDGFCVHIEDGSPKYELGGRPLPGKGIVSANQIFENITEPDDFLKAVARNGKQIPWEPTEEVEYKRKLDRQMQPAVKSPKTKVDSATGRRSGHRKRQTNQDSGDRDKIDQPVRKKARIESDTNNLKEMEYSLPEALIVREDLDEESQLRKRAYIGRPSRVLCVLIKLTVDGQRIHPTSDQSSHSITQPSRSSQSRKRKRSVARRLIPEPSSTPTDTQNQTAVARNSTTRKIPVSSNSGSSMLDHPLLDELDIFEVFPAGKRNAFLSEMGWSTKELMTISVDNAGNQYAAWRHAQADIEPLEEGLECVEIEKMKEKVTKVFSDKLADAVNAESAKTSRRTKSPNRSRNAAPKQNGHSFKKRGKDIYDPFDVLPDSMMKFAQSVGITSARSFLEMSNAKYAGKYMAFRQVEGLSKLADKYSAGSMLANNKKLIREAALKLGDIELGSLYDRAPNKSVAGSVPVVNELGDNDFCMYCAETGELIICDQCDRSCHLSCLDPPLKVVPDGDWFCPDCNTKTTSKESHGDDRGKPDDGLDGGKLADQSSMANQSSLEGAVNETQNTSSKAGLKNDEEYST